MRDCGLCCPLPTSQRGARCPRRAGASICARRSGRPHSRATSSRRRRTSASAAALRDRVPLRRPLRLADEGCARSRARAAARGPRPLAERFALPRGAASRRLRAAVGRSGGAASGLDRLAGSCCRRRSRTRRLLRASRARRPRAAAGAVCTGCPARAVRFLPAACVELCAETNTASVRVLRAKGSGGDPATGCCARSRPRGRRGDRAHAWRRSNRRAFGAERFTRDRNSARRAARVARRSAPGLPGEGAPLAAKGADICDGSTPRALAPWALDRTRCLRRPCNLVHGQRVSAAPRRLSRRSQAGRWSRTRSRESCCGAAGTTTCPARDGCRAGAGRKDRVAAKADPDLVAKRQSGQLPLRSCARALARG